MSGRDRRRFYRLRYPTKERPELVLGDQTFPVTELSEGGLRILAKELPQTGVHGILRLKDGQEIGIEGSAVRQEGDEAIIVDLKGVEFSHLVSEHRRLLLLYPDMRSDRR